MYFSVYHSIALFICTTVALFAAGYLGWLCFQERKKAADEAAKTLAGKKLIGYCSIILAAWVVLTGSTLVGLESALKSSELRGLSVYSAGDFIALDAQIYNSGRVALASCEISLRQSNAAPKKADSSVFVRAMNGERGGSRGAQSYEETAEFKGILAPKMSKRVNMRVSKKFARYTTLVKLSCR